LTPEKSSHAIIMPPSQSAIPRLSDGQRMLPNSLIVANTYALIQV
jgi:hypothetical protein